MRQYIKIRSLGDPRYALNASILLMFILAAIVTSSIYPFIATADGIKRINTATGVGDSFSVLPPLQSIFFRFSIEHTGGMGAYTFLQTSIFYISILALYRHLLIGEKLSLTLKVALATLCFPVFLFFPAILTDSALVFSCIALLSVLIFKIASMSQRLSSTNTAQFFIYYIALLFVLFGIRLNTMILAPVILIAIWSTAPKFRVFAFIGILTALCCVFIVNQDYRKMVKPEALGMAWEIIGVVNAVTNDYEMRPLRFSLNFCGDTEAAAGRYHSRFLNPIFWDSNPPLPAQCITSAEGSEKVKSAYVDIIKTYPLEWLNVKLAILSRIIGIVQLENIRRGIHGVDEVTIKYGGQDTIQQKISRYAFFYSTDWAGLLTYRPIVSMFLALVSLVSIYHYARERFLMFAITICMSNLYYIGFLVNAQSAEFRYYAPTFFINFVAFIAASAVVFLYFLRKNEAINQAIQ